MTSASEAFERDLLAAASDAETADRLARAAVERTVVAVAVRGSVTGEGDAVRVASLVARVHHLLAVHGASAGGTPHPSGGEVGLASFPDPARAVLAALDLGREVEQGRPPSAHRHGGLLGVGVARGPVWLPPDGRAVGVPAWRAARLAVHASGRGELLVAAGVLPGAPPAGLGLHASRVDLGFQAFHLVDYR